MGTSGFEKQEGAVAAISNCIKDGILGVTARHPLTYHLQRKDISGTVLRTQGNKFLKSEYECQ